MLANYNEPIKIIDDELGVFVLNKDFPIFEGSFKWLNNDVSVYLQVDSDDKESWKIVINILKKIYAEQNQKDIEFKNFAAKELIDYSNDSIWQEGLNEEITISDFKKRIKLSQLQINFQKGDFIAFYDDGDMFHGMIISACGNIKEGLMFATI